MALEYAFEMAASSIRFGRGVTREIGMDLAEMAVKKVMVLTDARLAKLQPVDTVLQSLRDNRITHALFDRVRVEPTDVSFREAITFATEGGFDAFVAVGGGSTIDTAKAARGAHSLHSVGGDALISLNATVPFDGQRLWGRMFVYVPSQYSAELMNHINISTQTAMPR